MGRSNRSPLSSSSDTPREEEWLKAVTVSLHIKAEYVKVKLIRLIGMMLVVFVKKELQEHVSDVAACTVGTGILGKMVSILFPILSLILFPILG